MESHSQIHDKFKYWFITRGLPGSGKSTVARKIAGTEGVVHSTDIYIDKSEGESTFTSAKMVEIHEKNFAEFSKSIDAGIGVVVVDHTNVWEWEIQKYSDYATQNNYIVSIVTLPHITAEVAASRTSHGLTQKKIDGIMSIWEPFDHNHLKQKSFDLSHKKSTPHHKSSEKLVIQAHENEIKEEDEGDS